jgi:hypothetical protein
MEITKSTVYPLAEQSLVLLLEIDVNLLRTPQIGRGRRNSPIPCWHRAYSRVLRTACPTTPNGKNA